MTLIRAMPLHERALCLYAIAVACIASVGDLL